MGRRPMHLAWDGANVWVADQRDNTVTKLRGLDGVNLGTFAVGNVPFAVAFDGAAGIVYDGLSIWVASNGPNGVASDGTFVWVANFGSDTVSVLR